MKEIKDWLKNPHKSFKDGLQLLNLHSKNVNLKIKLAKNGESLDMMNLLERELTVISENKAKEEANKKASAEAKAKKEAAAKKEAEDKATAEAKAKNDAAAKKEAEDKATAEAKAKNDAAAKKEAEDKATAEAKAKTGSNKKSPKKTNSEK